MDGVSISTERLRGLLQQVREQSFDYRVCSARDIVGPGGGVYITADSELNEHHVAWLERRNPAAAGETYVEVVFYRGSRDAGPRSQSVPTELELEDEEQADREDSRRERAEKLSRDVTASAGEVARRAEAMYRTINQADFSVADLRRTDTEGGVREFERRVHAFHVSVRRAVDEYLQGNTLVMDLILKFQLGKKTVRHALNVAAFATETAVQLALKQGDDEDGLRLYFGDLPREDLLEQAGMETEAYEVLPEQLDEARMTLFRRELVEIFLGGFMHDCGLWNEPFCLDEGHEINGAKLIWELKEVRRFAPSLVKIILFHSDVIRLADRYGVVKVVESPEDAERIEFKREFFRTRQDACTAMDMRPGDFAASILSAADLRKVMPVALAERYITQTQDISKKAHWEVIGDLARHVAGGLYMRYVAALCNSQVDVVAPRRAYVRLHGSITITTEDRRETRRAQRLDVTDFEAVSLWHGRDRNSPHLITLFIRHPDGSRARADYVGPKETALWERCAGPESRMYLPAGRLRTNLSVRVTGFVSEDVYGRLLGDYEQEFRLRSR